MGGKYICPIQTTAINRRTSNQTYWLKPDRPDSEGFATLQNTIGYLFGRYAKIHQIECHAFTTMSNHYHAVITDMRGERSLFFNEFHSMLARYCNRLHDRSGDFWDNGKTGDFILIDDGAIADKIVYATVNPVEAGLVSRHELWQHFTITPKDWGSPLEFTRPSGVDETWPESVIIMPTVPPEFRHLDEPIEHFNRLIAQRTSELRMERQLEGQRFGSMEQAFDINPWDNPHSHGRFQRVFPRLAEPVPAQRSAPLPSFCAEDPDIHCRAREEHQQFNEDYDAALSDFQDDKDTVFPAGTYLLRERYNVNIASLDPLSLFHRPVLTPCPLSSSFFDSG